MQIHPLPENASLENLKKRAKSLLKAAQAQDGEAQSRVGPYVGDPAKITLQSAQLVLAREFGFSSWRKLKHHIQNNTGSNEPTADQLANQFLDLVVVHYTPVADIGPARFQQASVLLERHPEILSESIYTAAAIGDTAQLDHWLDIEPGLLDRKGGFHDWEPLMYAAYARLPGRSSLATALRLLERGANPNAYYMSFGQYRFTALAGAFGHGEGGTVNQPEHPDYQQLCRTMLQYGAKANDSQAAYNRGLGPDNVCLEMLLEFGLNATEKNNWPLRDGDEWIPNPSETMHFQFIQAIRRGYVERAKLLIDNGVDVNKPDDTYDTRTKGKSPLETALITGEQEIADYLVAHGADESNLPPLTLLQAACSTGDLDSAEALLHADPLLRQAVKPLEREMLCEAVGKNNQPALALMFRLEFELNDNTGRPPLHEAALEGNLELVKQLINAGADTSLRDPDHLVPASGFAQHARHQHVVEFFDTVEMDIFSAAARNNLEQLQHQLEENPAKRDMTFAEIRPDTKQEHNENDWMTPLVYAALNNRVEAVRYLLARGADPTVNNGRGMDLLKLLASNNDCAEASVIIKSALDDF